jgi:hypothetical protein
MPKLVEHYIFIRHEDLLYDFENTMNLLQSKGLPLKKGVVFPKQIHNYYEGPTKKPSDFVKKNRTVIPKRMIMSKLDLKQEEKIFGNYLITEE